MSFRTEPRTLPERVMDLERRMRALQTGRAVDTGIAEATSAAVDASLAEVAATATSALDVALLAWIAVGMGG